MNKLELINSIEVIEDSASCGELEYVLVANTPENREKLLLIGVPQQEIEDATDDFDSKTIAGRPGMERFSRGDLTKEKK
jgi:hypothetical protein